MDRSFLEADVDEVVTQLSQDEKILLLGGSDFWRTNCIARLSIPSVKLTDGPNGARGEKFFRMIPATVLPNAVALAATFSKELAHLAGSLLAAEAKARNASCLLGPTVNMARNPLGGRTFESFSEDPTLSGIMASHYINGLQSNGIGAALKHFVANDQEHERMGTDCVINSRTLREIYLRPFHLAQAYSKPWSYMTSYNKLNGTHCSENSWLLEELLQKEWGFDGLVMSDWFGTYSVAEAINAGLDLEMPGPPRWRRKELVRQSLNAYKIQPDKINERVTRLLAWVQKLARADPDLVYHRIHADERTRYDARDEDAQTVRQIGTEAIVMLKNDNGALPIRHGRVSVIGPNAKADVITGGGSARLRASWTVSPWQGLVNGKPEAVSLTYALGCKGAKFLPPFGPEIRAPDGQPGFQLMHFAIIDGKQAPTATVSELWDNSDLILYDFYHPHLGKDYFTEIRGILTAPFTGHWDFEASVTGQGWLYVDDEMVLDISKEQKRTSSFFGNGTEGTTVHVPVELGRTYHIRFVHDSRAPPKPPGTDTTPLEIVGLKLGSFPMVDEDTSIEEAIEIASVSDTVVFVVGLNQDWESESYDRPTLSLPLRTNELIERVCAACPSARKVVAIQAGSAVSMPWIDKVDAVVYACYGGNESGNALADILYGHVNPSGRLPLSLPKREIDIAANLSAKSARRRIEYSEGIWIGYRHFNARGVAPLYPFGHGLSFTRFQYSDLIVTRKSGETAADWRLEAKVDVLNKGPVAGRHSVHFYVSAPQGLSTALPHPTVTLQAFAKTAVLPPGGSATVSVTLDKYAVSHWDELTKRWRMETGSWQLHVGKDAQTMEITTDFEIPKDLSWTGL